jgi:Spy/CpxP family protein refolding chaperone
MRINVNPILPLFAVALILSAFPSSQGRCLSPQDPPGQQPDAAADSAVKDPIAQLNLTPEQRQKIRAIRQQTQLERATVNQRLRESNIALQQALDADNPDEAVVEQRLRDAAAAQAASTRMRVLTEVRIRRVLTPEQQATLRSLRLQAAGARREQRLENRPARQGVDGTRPAANQRNGLAPLLPRRPNAQPSPRP